MGVRKHLRGKQFFTCDWTAQPMDAAYAQRAVFKQCPNGEWKMSKTGAYICYEAALAHTRELELERLEEAHGKENVNPLDFDHQASEAYLKAVEWIQSQTSFDIKPAPHFTELVHFGGSMTVSEFNSRVTVQNTPIQAVLLKESGPAEKFIGSETLSENNRIRNALYPNSFKATRQRKDKKNKNCDVMVFYNNTKSAPKNRTASDLFRQEILGDALIVLVCKEPSYMSRQRLLHYSVADFNEDYSRNKKRKADAPNALTSDEYAAVKAEAQQSINAFEANISESAMKPTERAKAQKIPPSCGKEIAQLAKARLKAPKQNGKRQLAAALASSTSEPAFESPPVLKRTNSLAEPPWVQRQSAFAPHVAPNLEEPFLAAPPAGVV